MINKPITPRGLILPAMFVAAFHGGGQPDSAAGQSLNTYHVGNSLTWDARVSSGLPALATDAGLELNTGYHIRCSMPLSYIAANPDDVCVDPNSFGTYTEAFANNAWDAITLQPFSGSTPNQEYLAFKSLMQLARQNPDNLDTNFYLYASWPAQPPVGVTFYDTWHDPTPVDPNADLLRNANGFNWIFNQLQADPDLQGINVYMIPVGDVLAEVDLRMSQGLVPGFAGADELYRDNLHLNNLGRFVAANTFLATLFGQDPTGTPTNTNFDTIPGQVTPIVITTELATAVQQAVWDIVSTDPLTGVLPGDLNADGFVVIDDLNIILNNWNQAVPLADPSADGFVGVDDLNIILVNWDSGTPPASPIPEPGAMTLLALGLTRLLRREKGF